MGLALVGLVALSGCYKMPDDAVGNDDAPLYAAPSFTLTDQDGNAFSSDRLKGKVWIATLFYTSCPGPCPMMSGRMRKIQKAVDDPNVMLVSFSIDPKRDTPAALKDYARNMSADPARWVFLTGDAKNVYDVANTGLKLGYEPAKGEEEIIHSTKFLLIDKNGQVRGAYSTAEDESMKKLETDAKKLAKA